MPEEVEEVKEEVVVVEDENTESDSVYGEKTTKEERK
jgi:hypothetical protein